jgi:hypothetical protein
VSLRCDALVEGGIAVVGRQNKRKPGIAFAEASEVSDSVFLGPQDVQHAAADDLERDLRYSELKGK